MTLEQKAEDPLYVRVTNEIQASPERAYSRLLEREFTRKAVPANYSPTVLSTTTVIQASASILKRVLGFVTRAERAAVRSISRNNYGPEGSRKI